MGRATSMVIVEISEELQGQQDRGVAVVETVSRRETVCRKCQKV